MNVLVVGLGSMGKRRIRLIKEIDSKIIIFGVDSNEQRQKLAKEEFGIECYASVSDVVSNNDVDCAFVCTSPLSHNAIISECLSNHLNVFTELNLVSDGYEENIRLAEKNDVKLFLSSTFLYREEIGYIRSEITQDKKWNYVYHVGQYLPDWHPWENYKDFFVGDKRTNGCREIMAIELPWIIKVFGNIKEATSVSDKITDLSINYNDNYMIRINHENGNKGVLVVDVVSPVAVRRLEAYAENSYYQWNGTPDSLFKYDENIKDLVKVSLNENAEHMQGYRQFIVENAYKNEIMEFFDVVNNNKQAQYGFEDDLQVLKLIDDLEKVNETA